MLRLFRYTRQSGQHAFLDAALVLSPDYSEQPVLAPSIVPRVGAQPILNTVLRAPADDFDRVAAFHFASFVLVYPYTRRIERANTTINWLIRVLKKYVYPNNTSISHVGL